MAKFRKIRRAYSGVKRFSRRSARATNKSISTTELLIGMAAYAAVRPKVADMIPDGFLGLPVAYSDNITLGVPAGLAAWKGSGYVKKAGIVVAATETLIGVSKLTSGMMNNSSSNNNSSVYD
jgi:hypothetical protein